MEGVLDIGSPQGVEITVSPGTEFDFLSGAYLRVGNWYPGALVAKGSDNVPIVFASYVPGEYWGADTDRTFGGGIRIEKNAGAETVLINCKIQNATSGVYVDANVKIQSCLFKDCQFYGLIRDKNANPVMLSGNSYSGNGKDSSYVVP